MENDRLVQERIRKITEIRERGLNPYPYNFDKTHNTDELQETYKNLKPEEYSEDIVKTAGRVMQKRVMGRVAFLTVRDEFGEIQIYLQEDKLGKAEYKILKKIDIGDIIGVSGNLFRTKMGELSVFPDKFEILTKSIKPLPDKYHGLKDKEIRYRERYTDLIVNPEVKDIFKKRSAIIKAIRDFLHERNFMEVETPLLQTQYGGAAAKPFKTHINAWGMQMFLSISPETYLKRISVGGFEKIFTICKNFRNEGVDATHNPEFTMIEIYEAYKDYNDMMKLIEECYEFVAIKVNGSTKVTHSVIGKDGKNKEVTIDFKAPWPKMTMSEAIMKYLSIDVDNMSKEELFDFASKNDLDVTDDMTWGKLILEIFDIVESKIIQPTHIYKIPKEGTPLCKRHRKDDRFNEQCEPVGMGMELGNMYSELNDPIMQEEELNKQAINGRGGDDEAHPMDDDFLNAIRTGLPPTGGIGWGIDRMVILLTGAESIRDVIFFPTMKPRVKEVSGKKNKETKIAVVLVNKGLGLETWKEMSTIAHLNAAFGARVGTGLLQQDTIETKDNSKIKLNIKHAIMIKRCDTSAEILNLIREAKEKGLEISEFTSEMIETTDDRKIIENTQNKDLSEINYLGVLVFGNRKEVDALTKKFELF